MSIVFYCFECKKEFLYTGKGLSCPVCYSKKFRVMAHYRHKKDNGGTNGESAT